MMRYSSLMFWHVASESGMASSGAFLSKSTMLFFWCISSGEMYCTGITLVCYLLGFRKTNLKTKQREKKRTAPVEAVLITGRKRKTDSRVVPTSNYVYLVPCQFRIFCVIFVLNWTENSTTWIVFDFLVIWSFRQLLACWFWVTASFGFGSS